MIVGTAANFEKEVLKSDVPVLVDFWAPWCGPCRMLSPVIEKLSEDAGYKGKLKFVKVSVDDESALAGKYNVMSIPTLMIFKKGKMTDVHMGAMPEPDLRDWIEKNIGKK